MERLAVDHVHKGQGPGAALLADLLHHCLRSEIAAHALIVDAKDEGAAGIYRHHGFIVLPDSTRTLFLPLATVR
jgi:ribosomal protein S18 acetylase RimI-like enzyme